MGPFRVLFWSMAALLALLGARMAGVDSTAVAALALPPTLALLVGAFALVEIELSPIVPGANDNASGVATALSIAERLETEPLRTSRPGSPSTAPRSRSRRACARSSASHRDELDRERPTSSSSTRSGSASPVRDRRRLGHRLPGRPPPGRALRGDRRCRARARRPASAPSRFAAASPATRCRRASAAIARSATSLPRDRRLPDHRLPGDTPATLDPEALERAHDFALELIRPLDRDLGRRTRPATTEAVAA